MKESEYKLQLEKIEEEAKEKTNKVHCQFVMDLVKFKCGDIIKSKTQTIKILKIQAYIAFDLPIPLYIGEQLTKKLMPMKNKKSELGYIYGNENTILIKSA